MLNVPWKTKSFFFFFFSAPGLNLKETEPELEFCVGTKKKSVVLAR